MPVTNAQIDAAVPPAGVPNRALTNTALKGLITDIANAVLGLGTPSVVDFASLPAAATATGQFYYVQTSTGVWLVNRKTKGLYVSDGAAWSYVGDFPQTADQVGFTPAAGIAATNTQAAIEEVVSDTASLLAGKASTGAVGSTGITMATARLLGRSTASTGAVEEITLGTNLSFTGTTLNAAGGGGGSVVKGSELVTSGTTWTTPSDITTSTLFKITIVGAGAGGAGCAATLNIKVGGGGGGGVAVLYITGLSPSTGYTIAIGALGAGGAAGANAGSAGGNTSITISGTTYTANGGSGGATGTVAAGGAGGATVNIPAAPSFSINGESGGFTGITSDAVTSGKGGSSGLGFGLGGSGRCNNDFGNPASGYGAGGAGASTNSATARAGQDGRRGCILFEWVGS
jgi:hypothetical protein